jgi:hypothetical protein
MSPIAGLRRALALVAALALAAAVSGCFGDNDRQQAKAPPASPARPDQRPAKALRLVELHALNGSGVRGVARLLLDGRSLSVESVVSGAAAGRMHMQHVHVPPGHADGTCPTRALDTNRDGLVSLKEGLGAYGPPTVSLAPFPDVKGSSWNYTGTLTTPARLALDRGVLVLHGMRVHGKYDQLMPIACGTIDKALTREVLLEPVNNSGIAGTARVALAGSRLYAWLSLGGETEGRMHMQHIHLPKGNGRGSCPTPDLDRNGDGLVSLQEGLPAYGAPAVSLEPFPTPESLFVFEYSHVLRVRPGLPLDRGVIVVHGMDVNGSYDETIPVACGAIDPRLPAARSSQAGASAPNAAYP